MTAPEDFLSELDLYGKPQEEAAQKARVLARALAGQQHHALLGMLGTVPELQKAGAEQFAQAGKEREGLLDTGAKVLATTLAKERNDIARVQAEKELAALQQQIAYQNAQLGLMNRQFGESVRKTHSEEDRADYEAYRRGLNTPPAGLVEREGKTAGEIANIENIARAAGELPLVPKKAAKAIGGVLSAGKQAELKAMEEEKKKSGYRTEAPLSFEEFVRAKSGGGAPRAAATPTNIAPQPPANSDMVTVQIPGYPPGPIHRSQLGAFQAKHPEAKVLGP